MICVFSYVKASVGFVCVCKTVPHLLKKRIHMQKYIYGRLHLKENNQPNKQEQQQEQQQKVKYNTVLGRHPTLT